MEKADGNPLEGEGLPRNIPEGDSQGNGTPEIGDALRIFVLLGICVSEIDECGLLHVVIAQQAAGTIGPVYISNRLVDPAQIFQDISQIITGGAYRYRVFIFFS